MLLFAMSLAMADVVDPAPEDCPTGSYGTTSHWGPACEANTCSSDTECAEGDSCVPLGLCVVERTWGGDTNAYTFFHATGSCEEVGDCDEGTCVIEDRCGQPGGGGSGCGGCTSGEGPNPLWAALGGLLLLVARRV